MIKSTPGPPPTVDETSVNDGIITTLQSRLQDTTFEYILDLQEYKGPKKDELVEPLCKLMVQTV